MRRVSTFSIYYVNRDSFDRLNFCVTQLIISKKVFHIFRWIGNGSRIVNVTQFVTVATKRLSVSGLLFGDVFSPYLALTSLFSLQFSIFHRGAKLVTFSLTVGTLMHLQSSFST